MIALDVSTSDVPFVLTVKPGVSGSRNGPSGRKRTARRRELGNRLGLTSDEPGLQVPARGKLCNLCELEVFIHKVGQQCPPFTSRGERR